MRRSRLSGSSAWFATITRTDFERLAQHLFQGGREEHAAFLLAGVARCGRGRRLLIREVIPVADSDFVAEAGCYRIAPRATARAARRAHDLDLALVWAHSHPGSGRHAGFSAQDMRTIAASHPSLLDITGTTVGAFVFGENAVAGEVWTPGEAPARLGALRVLGSRVLDLDDGTAQHPIGNIDARHSRQILMFGDAGQARLRSLKVAVVGVGGGGSLIVEQLARLGVGEIWLIDFDRVSRSNLSRIVGSRALDALLHRRKVLVARRLIRRIDPTIIVRAIAASASTAEVAAELAHLDALFVATDTALGRHAANALSYQYMIPAFQVGAKVQTGEDGQVSTIHTAVRIAMPGHPCWHCQGAIPADLLHQEQLGELERNAQNYLGGGEDIADPSVISLNAIPVGVAVTDFLLMFCGLLPDNADLSARIWNPLERRAARRPSRRRPGCGWCDQTGPMSAFGRGDSWPLPLPPAGLVSRLTTCRTTAFEVLRALRSARQIRKRYPAPATDSE
jgi:hypothetical protein